VRNPTNGAGIGAFVIGADSNVPTMADLPIPNPDTKNWTWVLDRPCPDCEFDASAVPRDDIGNQIRTNAARFRQLLKSGDRVLARPPDGPDGPVWSALEYGAHVRDVYDQFHQRFLLMLTEDDPRFENWDQDATAREADYASADPGQVAVDLALNAGKLADLLDKIHGDQWQRRGHRSDGSDFTVESMAFYLLHDPVHHVWDVEQGFEALADT